MATFEETLLGFNPINYWRLVELVGPMMHDIGTAPIDGSFFNDAVFGRPSPVETDPAAFAVGFRVGISAAPAPVNNFSFGGFGYYNPANVSASGIICRNGQPGLPGSNMITIDHGLGVIGARINPDANPLVFYDLSYSLSVEGWYFVTVVRNGTVIKLFVNDFQADENTSFTADPMTNPAYLDGGGFGWKIGVTGDSGNVFGGERTAETFVFDYPITLANHQEIYAAAFNSLRMRGYSNVISSAVLYSGTEPSPISFPFRHNWTDDLIERISFATGISTAVKGYEQANGQRIKPRREIEITQVLKDDVERRMFRAKLSANQNRKWFWPILEDRERLTSPISSGVNTITTDTLYKDYEIGGYVGLRQLNEAGRITAWEELQITGLTDTEITTATNTVNSYTRPEVYPVRRAIINESASLRGHTDSVEETTITALLIAEDEKVTPHRIIEWTPPTTYKGYEVFDFAKWPNDWTDNREYDVNRARQNVNFELGVFGVESDSLAANESFSWRVLTESKQRQAELLGWFYARAGSLNYLWVPTMQRDFAVVSGVGSNLTVESHNYYENFAGSEYRRDLAFIYHDGTITIRRITGVALSGANEVLTLASPGVPTLSNLRSVSFLLFCRVESDTIERALTTDSKGRFAWRFQQLLSSPE